MEWFDDEVFAEFCRKRDLVPERYLSFYIRWIKRFVHLSSSRGISAVPGEGVGKDEDRLLFFLEHLRADVSVEDWQVEQARRAVGLYLNVFLPVAEERGRIAGGSPALPAVADEPSAVQKESRPTGGGTVGGGARPSPGDALLRMKELIRLRHYSYSTEQTYLDWVKRYIKYVSERGLDFVETDSMRSFLSYLAIQRKVASSTQNQAFNAVLFLLREVLGVEQASRLSAAHGSGFAGSSFAATWAGGGSSPCSLRKNDRANTIFKTLATSGCCGRYII